MEYDSELKLGNKDELATKTPQYKHAHTTKKENKLSIQLQNSPLVSSIFSLSQAVDGEENDNSYVHVGHDLIAILFSKSVGIKDIKSLNIKYSCSAMV